MEKLEPIKINIQITDVCNKSLRQIINATEAVTHIYHAVKNSKFSVLPPLETDAIPITLNDPESKRDPELINERTLAWVFKKAFEEYILGLSESLIEAHRCVMFCKLSLLTQKEKFTEDVIRKRISEINNAPLKKNFPTLLIELEEELGTPLPLKTEILSINKVRNCLVHAGGIVSEKDINNKENNCLTLSYIDFITHAEKNGELIEVKWEDKKDGFITNKMVFESRPRQINFLLGKEVRIDQNILNGITNTCMRFAMQLLEMMPKIS